MSGHSYGETCIKCGGEMDCYSDHKPHSYESGECLECGFSYYTVDDQMTLEDVNQQRIDCDLEPLKELKKQEEEL